MLFFRKKIKSHEWTHTGTKVLLLRCGTIGSNDFQWPKSGKTICPKAKANRKLAQTPDCESGGLFGWPWGLGIGEGKEPNYRDDWIVFSANPEDVIWVNGKAKAIGEVEIVHCGPWYECQKILEKGKRAWIVQNSDSASTSGDRSSASTSGNYSSASTSGNYSSAFTSGPQSSASTSGPQSSASTSGNRSSASTSGYSSSAFTSGFQSSASTSGDSSSATTSGNSSSASTSGYYSSASTDGSHSIASCCGDYCAVVALGDKSIAAVVGENPTVEVGKNCIGAVFANEFTWIAHPGAMIFQKCLNGKTYTLSCEDYTDGQKIFVVNGVMTPIS